MISAPALPVTVSAPEPVVIFQMRSASATVVNAVAPGLRPIV